MESLEKLRNQKPRSAQRFEDLVAWQQARDMTRSIYALTRKDLFSKDFALRDQLRRATISVMSNIAEGFERGSRTEFHQYLVVAKGSCGEVRSQLYAALDAEYITPSQFEEISKIAMRTTKLIAALRSAVQKQRDAKRKIA